MNKRVCRIGEMILATGTEVRVTYSVFLPTYLQQIPHALDWEWTRTFVVTGWPLAAWAKERQIGTYTNS